MGKIKRYKNSVERFLSGEKGQRFFNFAYSIGAAIVIWGALFKILHLPGGNMLLSIGMGTEVLMFVLTAFDRPPREYHWEEVFPVLSSKNPEDRPDFNGDGGVKIVGGGVVSGQMEATIGGQIPVGAGGQRPAVTEVLIPDDATPSERYAAQMTALSEQMDQLRKTTESLNHVSEVLLESYRAITENSENITRSSSGYVEEMQSLNRNIAGLNTIYEIQLKSVSSQLDSIDRVNKGIKDIRDMYEKSSAMSERYCEETEKMARYMQQLNQVYEKMLHAMTINMYRPMGGMPEGTTVSNEVNGK
ncbi:MAG: gliding motility protein GldL [Candidatus Homeothermus sp.]|nr:gliding motility protein GldL [Candidatus Homeothermus sp.]